MVLLQQLQVVHSFIRMSNFGLRLNVLKYLRVSASNVLEMFLNIIISIGCAVVVFHSYKPIRSTNTLFFLLRTSKIFPRLSVLVFFSNLRLKMFLFCS